MVNRLKKMKVSSESDDQSRSSSDSEDSTFAPEVRNALGRKRRSGAMDRAESDSDCEETIIVPGRRVRRRVRRDRTQSEDVSRRRNRRSRRRHVDSDEPEDAKDPSLLFGQYDTESEDSYEGRGVRSRNGRKRDKKTRRNGKVVEAIWTPDKTVRITYETGMKHACMNPIHGKTKHTYKVLHLVKCSWKKNVDMMTDVPSTERSKPYQYCHKLCDPCLSINGNRCFKCAPVEGAVVTPILQTVLGFDSVTTVAGFRDSISKWEALRREAGAPYLVLHCTMVGPEARLLRQRFALKRTTRIHVVYSDVLGAAGSGINLEQSTFQQTWKLIMKEKVPCHDSDSVISFYGNILVNESLTFNDFRVNDVLLMYERHIFDSLELDVLRFCVNSLHVQALPHAQSVDPSECCLWDAVVHAPREPTSPVDDCMFQGGNLLASLFYNAVKRYFSRKIVSEFEERAGLGEALRIGDDGHKLPFRKLFAAKGGEVPFRRVSNAIQDVARSDPRSRVCGWDTSGFELVCWMQRGTPWAGISSSRDSCTDLRPDPAARSSSDPRATSTPRCPRSIGTARMRNLLRRL